MACKKRKKRKFPNNYLPIIFIFFSIILTASFAYNVDVDFNKKYQGPIKLGTSEEVFRNTGTTQTIGIATILGCLPTTYTDEDLIKSMWFYNTLKIRHGLLCYLDA